MHLGMHRKVVAVNVLLDCGGATVRGVSTTKGGCEGGRSLPRASLLFKVPQLLCILRRMDRVVAIEVFVGSWARCC